jgi:hypothetical protein
MDAQAGRQACGDGEADALKPCPPVTGPVTAVYYALLAKCEYVIMGD